MGVAKVLRVLVVACLLPACSLAWVKGPEEGRDTCTQSKRWPGLDTAGVIAALFAPIVVKATSDAACSANGTCDKLAGLSLLGTFAIIPLGISAVVGFNRVEECREAHHRAHDPDE